MSRFSTINSKTQAQYRCDLMARKEDMSVDLDKLSSSFPHANNSIEARTA